MSTPDAVIVCVGKDCRRAPGFDALLAAAARVPGSCQVPCQDLCHGPIVGVRIDGDVRWFHRIRKRGHREAVLRSVARGRFVRSLADREVRKRRQVVRHPGKVRAIRTAA